MKVLGIDASTFTGLNLWEPETEFSLSKLLHFKGYKGMERVQLIARAFDEFVDQFNPDVAVVESLAWGGMKAITLTEIVTPIKLSLMNKGIPYYLVNPMTLKQWAAGSAKADKKAMAAAVKEKFGYVSASDDLVDAYALSHMGVVLHRQKDQNWLKKVEFCV
jgi:Holliday junction resolvasome RuvABC endonuclease subunit